MSARYAAAREVDDSTPLPLLWLVIPTLGRGANNTEGRHAPTPGFEWPKVTRALPRRLLVLQRSSGLRKSLLQCFRVVAQNFNLIRGLARPNRTVPEEVTSVHSC